MKAIDIIKNEGIEMKTFIFLGHCCGENEEGFPYLRGTYETVCYGTLENYYSGADKVGDWVKVFDNYMPGSPEVPGMERTIYVREKDAFRARRALQNHGKTKIVF